VGSCVSLVRRRGATLVAYSFANDTNEANPQPTKPPHASTASRPPDRSRRTGDHVSLRNPLRPRRPLPSRLLPKSRLAPAAEKGAVAIIGTGTLAGALGPALGGAGYRVIYGSRDPSRDAVRALVAAVRAVCAFQNRSPMAVKLPLKEEIFKVTGGSLCWVTESDLGVPMQRRYRKGD